MLAPYCFANHRKKKKVDLAEAEAAAAVGYTTLCRHDDIIMKTGGSGPKCMRERSPPSAVAQKDKR